MVFGRVSNGIDAFLSGWSFPLKGVAIRFYPLSDNDCNKFLRVGQFGDYRSCLGNYLFTVCTLACKHFKRQGK